MDKKLGPSPPSPIGAFSTETINTHNHYQH